MQKKFFLLLILFTVGMLLISACSGQEDVVENKDKPAQEPSEAVEEKGTIKITNVE